MHDPDRIDPLGCEARDLVAILAVGSFALAAVTALAYVFGEMLWGG